LKEIPSPLKMKRKVLVPIERRSIQEALDLFVLQDDEKMKGLEKIMVDSTNNRAVLIYEDHAITIDNEGQWRNFMEPFSFQPLPPEKKDVRLEMAKRRVLKPLNR